MYIFLFLNNCYVCTFANCCRRWKLLNGFSPARMNSSDAELSQREHLSTLHYGGLGGWNWGTQIPRQLHPSSGCYTSIPKCPPLRKSLELVFALASLTVLSPRELYYILIISRIYPQSKYKYISVLCYDRDKMTRFWREEDTISKIAMLEKWK